MKKHFGTGRVCVADSWFGSVKSAAQLRKNGMFFTGQVKTCHKLFPEVMLFRACGSRPGDCAAANTTCDGVKLPAINQKDGRHSQMAATHGGTVTGTPRRHVRCENEMAVPRQRVTAMCCECFAEWMCMIITDQGHREI